jgi:probable O-glycosylation ligase (exosortase A-associated)
MKQFILLIAMVLVGSTGSLFNPFWGLMLYYTLSVLRPQDLWDWAMPEPWPWSRMAAGAVIVGVFLNLSEIWQRLRINLVPALLVLYGLLLTLSTLTAHDPGWSQHWLLEYAKVLLLAFITCIVVHRFWHIRTLAAVIVMATGYIAWEINYRYFFDGRLDIFHYGFGDLDNNGAGLMLAMGIPFAYAFAVSASRWWMRGVSALLGLVIIHAVLMTYSRGAMLASLIAMLWILWHHRPRLQAAAITLVLTVAVAFLAGPEIQDRFMSTAEFSHDYSAQSRMSSWTAAVEIVKEHPLTGVGIRNSNVYTHNYGADHVGRTIHSQYLQIAADSGIPAILVYLALVFSSLYMMSRCRRAVLDYAAEARGLHSPDHDDPRLFQMEKVILSAQASLLLFVFGSAFLSLEVFETPWLVMALASTLPRIVEHELAAMTAALEIVEPPAPATQETLDEPPTPQQTPKKKRPSILRFNPALHGI